jgi:hypothetical protein
MSVLVVGYNGARGMVQGNGPWTTAHVRRAANDQPLLWYSPCPIGEVELQCIIHIFPLGSVLLFLVRR